MSAAAAAEPLRVILGGDAMLGRLVATAIRRYGTDDRSAPSPA